MTTQYPAQIDNSTTLPTVIGGITSFNPASINVLRNAIIAIETELGVKPSGLYSTVRMRLDALESTLDHIISGETGSVTVIGVPQIGNAIIWSGTAWIPSNNFVNQSLSLSGKIAVGAESITPPVSSTNQGVIYFDFSQHRFLVSENGGAYEPLGAANINFSNDLSGNFNSQTVVGIRNIPVNLGTLTAGVPLVYDGTEWTAAVNEAVTTGPLLSTSLATSLMTLNGKAVLNAITPPVSVSSPGQGIIYFDSTNNEFMVSENGANYFPIVLNGDNEAFSTTGAVTTGPLLSTSTTTGLLTLTGAFIANGITAPSVSDPGQGIIYFDSTQNQYLVSQNGGAYVSLVDDSDNVYTITNITANYPVVAADRVIMVGTISADITITLQASPTVGRAVFIKDKNASAQTHFITIAGNGNTIDGNANYTLNVNYGSIQLVYAGSGNWSIV